MKVFNKIIVVVFLFSTIGVTAQLEGVFLDDRDGKTYKTVTYKIKENKKAYVVTWMAENLNFYTENSYCLNNFISNCEKYGRLYNWLEANTVCPIGWHLPSDKEWYQLADLFGGIENAGKHLKSKRINKNAVNGSIFVGPKPIKGTNKSAFNGLLAGSIDIGEGKYHRKEVSGFFWSATRNSENPEEAFDWSIGINSNKLRRWGGLIKTTGNSCRCVKN